MQQSELEHYESSDDETSSYNLVETNKLFMMELYKYLWELKIVCMAICPEKTMMELANIAKFDKKYRYTTRNRGKHMVFKYLNINELDCIPKISSKTIKDGNGCIELQNGDYLCDENRLRRSSYLLNTNSLTRELSRKLKSMRAFVSRIQDKMHDAFSYTIELYTTIQKELQTLYDLRILLNSLAYVVNGKKLEIGNVTAKDKLWELENSVFPVNMDKTYMLKYKFAQYVYKMKTPDDYSILISFPPDYSTISSISEIDEKKIVDVNGYAYYGNMPILFIKRSLHTVLTESISKYQKAIHEVAYGSHQDTARMVRLPKRNTTLTFEVLN